MLRATCAAVAAVALLLPAAASAQGGSARAAAAVQPRSASIGFPSEARRGFWYGGGLGAGAGSLRCGVCADEPDQGTAGYLRLGTTLNRSLLLGIEGSGWQRSASEGKRRVLALTGGAWWYPSPRHGYYLRGGLGISRWRAWSEDQAVVSQALAITVGSGYEVRLNPSLSIVPFFTAVGSAAGALWLEERDGDVGFERRRLPASGHTLLLQVGIGLTRH